MADDTESNNPSGLLKPDDIRAESPGDILRPPSRVAARPHNEPVAAGTLWICDSDHELKPLSLQGDPLDLTAHPPRVAAEALAAGAAPAALLLPGRRGTPPPWVLLVSGDCPVTVNGAPVLTGIRVLADRDEIRIAGADPVFFSTETLPVVEPFPGGPRTVYCPRCKLPIQPGTPAVRCPGCGVFHHQLDERPCYTYAPACAACGAPAELSGGYRWVPEGL